MKYFVDSCVWLNVIKKERRFFQGSLEFLSSGEELCISNLVLREIYWKTKEKYGLSKKLIKKSFCTIIKPSKEDYELARKLEKEYDYCLSFIDFMNIAICKNHNLTLVTRDKGLIEIAKEFIEIFYLD
jgi:predicted nucleic acid-binding protein